MAHRITFACAAGILAVIATAAPAAPHDTPPDHNRGLASEHQPIVSRTDFTLDVVTGPKGLAPGEAQRLSGWFDGLALGYGDTVTLADPGGWHGDPAADGVGMVLSRYGMLLSAGGAPVEAGRPAAGSVRVVVSRAVARVEGCPDWSVGNVADHANNTISNFGCAAAQDLAAMIANPQDLVEGAHAAPAENTAVSVKAIGSWRTADPTGKSGLPGGVTNMSAAKGN